MRKSWPFGLAVAVIGAGAGIAIAGLPADGDDLVLDSPTEDSIVEVDSTLTTQAPTSTTVSSSSTAPDEVSSIPETAATQVVDTTGAPIETALPEPDTLSRDQVRLVLANGDGRFDLVGRNAERLLQLGYVSIEQTDVDQRPASTVIYVRAGFIEEAAVLAADLGTPNALITDLPGVPATSTDDSGDLVVILGPDAQR